MKSNSCQVGQIHEKERINFDIFFHPKKNEHDNEQKQPFEDVFSYKTWRFLGI